MTRSFGGLLAAALMVLGPTGAQADHALPDTPCVTAWGIDWAVAMSAPPGVQVVCHTCIDGEIPAGGLGTCAAGDPFTNVVKGRGFIGNNVVYIPTDMDQLLRVIDSGELSIRWCFDQGTPWERCVTQEARDVAFRGANNDLTVCDFYCGSQGLPGGLPPALTDAILASIPMVGFYPTQVLHKEGYHSIDVYFINDSDETVTTSAPAFLPDLPPHSVSLSPGDHTCVSIVKKKAL